MKKNLKIIEGKKITDAGSVALNTKENPEYNYRELQGTLKEYYEKKKVKDYAYINIPVSLFLLKGEHKDKSNMGKTISLKEKHIALLAMLCSFQKSPERFIGSNKTLGRNFNVDSRTIQDWLLLLEKAGYIYRYMPNIGDRTIYCNFGRIYYDILKAGGTEDKLNDDAVACITDIVDICIEKGFIQKGLRSEYIEYFTEEIIIKLISGLDPKEDTIINIVRGKLNLDAKTAEEIELAAERKVRASSSLTNLLEKIHKVDEAKKQQEEFEEDYEDDEYDEEDYDEEDYDKEEKFDPNDYPIYRNNLRVREAMGGLELERINFIMLRQMLGEKFGYIDEENCVLPRSVSTNPDDFKYIHDLVHAPIIYDEETQEEF